MGRSTMSSTHLLEIKTISGQLLTSWDNWKHIELTNGELRQVERHLGWVETSCAGICDEFETYRAKS